MITAFVTLASVFWLVSACQSIVCDNGSTCEFSEIAQERGGQTSDVARDAAVDLHGAF